MRVNSLARSLLEDDGQRRVKDDDVGSITKKARGIVAEITKLQVELATATGSSRIDLRDRIREKWAKLNTAIQEANDSEFDALIKGIPKFNRQDRFRTDSTEVREPGTWDTEKGKWDDGEEI